MGRGDNRTTIYMRQVKGRKKKKERDKRKREAKHAARTGKADKS